MPGFGPALMLTGIGYTHGSNSLMSEYAMQLGEAVLRRRARVAEHSARLEADLSETQARLNELQSKKEAGQRFILSPEQQEELKKFKQKEGDAKKHLKEVRKNLRQDVESLQTELKWANIAGMPLLVAAAGILLAIIRKQRTKAT